MKLVMAALLFMGIIVGGCDDAELRVAPKQAEDNVQRQIKYGFSVSNPTNRVLKNVRVSVYAPLSEEGVQELMDIKATMPFIHDAGTSNAGELRFEFLELQPYAVKDIWITAVVNVSRRRGPGFVADVGRYLAASPFVEVGDARIAAQLAKLKAQSEMDTLKNIHAWMVENIQDEGYVKGDMGAVHALSQRKGDCTDQAYLFMAMSRALGVPARGVAGFVQPNDGVVRARDYHNWAEVLIDGVWRVVDPLRDKFLTEEDGYVAMAYLETDKGPSQGFFQVIGDGVVEFK